MKHGVHGGGSEEQDDMVEISSGSEGTLSNENQCDDGGTKEMQ
jgi:hypothetical protein